VSVAPKRLVLVTGGARAGKSAFAESLARELGGDDVAFIATAEALDDDMRRRIARHRADRPPAWSTTEAPLALAEAVAARTSAARVVLVDCLTLWVSNLLMREDRAAPLDAGLDGLVDAVIGAYATGSASLIVVTNEVGLGIVPANELSRRYRDLLGRVNVRFARRADEVYLVVAGIAVDVARLGRHVGSPA
jgi:adenosyl cobinamide kinase/adenosyl cobinamide phosphate guanylyltransferase